MALLDILLKLSFAVFAKLALKDSKVQFSTCCRRDKILTDKIKLVFPFPIHNYDGVVSPIKKKKKTEHV